MRKTNKIKYDEALMLLDTKKTEYINHVFGEDKPTKFYRADISSIVEYNINKILVRGKKELYNNTKNIKTTDIERIKEYLLTFDTDDKTIFIDYSAPLNSDFFTINGRYKLDEIFENERMSLNKEDLFQIQKELAEKYAAREGYSPCKYCGKQTPNDKLIEGEIFCRRFRMSVKEKHKYCSGTCIGYDQMSQEG